MASGDTSPTTEPDAFDAARRRAHELIEATVERLTATGMVVRYRSLTGVSWYLGLPGRSGTLRLSDHASPDPNRSDVVARITFGPNSLPTSEDKIMDLIAIGFGRYILKTGGITPPAPLSEAEETPVMGADAPRGVGRSPVTVSRSAYGE